MNLEDKAKNKLDQASGKAKETVGKLTDNEKLEAEGAPAARQGDARR